MADVLDILEIGRPGTPEVTKETIMGSGAQKAKPKYKPKNEVVKKPEGMARELFNLLVNDNKDPAPLFPTNTGITMNYILILTMLIKLYQAKDTNRPKHSLV